jgi:hypothetical protein
VTALTQRVQSDVLRVQQMRDQLGSSVEPPVVQRLC